jgi:hypothetical protein
MLFLAGIQVILTFLVSNQSPDNEKQSSLARSKTLVGKHCCQHYASKTTLDDNVAGNMKTKRLLDLPDTRHKEKELAYQLRDAGVSELRQGSRTRLSEDCFLLSSRFSQNTRYNGSKLSDAFANLVQCCFSVAFFMLPQRA